MLGWGCIYSQVRCVCALYGGLHVRRGRKLSPCAGGERGAFGAGGRALCGGGAVLQFGRLLRWLAIHAQTPYNKKLS